MLNRRFLVLTAIATAALAGCATRPTPVSVADTIAANPSLSTLNGLVAKAGLTDMLKGTGPFTVFAPTDEAFAILARLRDDPALRRAVGARARERMLATFGAAAITAASSPLASWRRAG